MKKAQPPVSKQSSIIDPVPKTKAVYPFIPRKDVEELNPSGCSIKDRSGFCGAQLIHEFSQSGLLVCRLILVYQTLRCQFIERRESFVQCRRSFCLILFRYDLLQEGLHFRFLDSVHRPAFVALSSSFFCRLVLCHYSSPPMFKDSAIILMY